MLLGLLLNVLILVRIRWMPLGFTMVWAAVLALCEVVAWYVFLAGSYLRDRRRENIREFIALADRLHARTQKGKDVLPLPPGG
jgi:hypothetical protein